MSEPTDHFDDENAICPYCLAENYCEAEDYSSNEREVECVSCEKTFIQSDDFTVTHYTKPLPLTK